APPDPRADARRRLPRQDRSPSRGRRRGRGGAREPAGSGTCRCVSRAVAVQVGYLADRSVVRTLRQPAGVVFPLVFPVLLLAVNAGGLRAETHLPGFPTDSFLAFALAVPFIQGGLFATGNAGIDIAKDIQTGFLNRLALTPMRGVALLAGELGGVMALGVVQAFFYLGVGLVFGVRLASGVLGGVVVVLLAALIAFGFSAFRA